MTKRFGGVDAVVDVSVACPAGRITALIGPNGAGKTTLFHLICGSIPPDAGRIYLDRTRLDRMPPHRVARLGVARLFQDGRVFAGLSALENVMAGLPRQLGENPVSALAMPRATAQSECRSRERAFEQLRLVGLELKSDILAGNLSYGEQKLVALARMLVAEPVAMLLDEPTAGIHPEMAQLLLSVLSRCADAGMAVGLIEHNMDVVLQCSQWVYLMDRGRIVSFGLPQEIMESREMSAAFLRQGLET